MSLKLVYINTKKIREDEQRQEAKREMIRKTQRALIQELKRQYYGQ